MSAPTPGAALDDRGLPPGYPFKPGMEITPREAKAGATSATGQAPMLLLDVRTKPEWDLVHIPGSIHIPLDQIEERHDEIELAPGQTLAVLCHHGVRSLKAAYALRALGQPTAVSVAGGIELWSLAADASVPRYERGPGVLRLITG